MCRDELSRHLFKIKCVKLDGFVKSSLFVMPDLIRHLEPVEFTGFRLPDRVRHRLRRNDGKTEELTFYEFIKNGVDTMEGTIHTLQEYMFRTETITYILIVIALFAITFFWKFLNGRDDEE
jgi:hypothetical protein